MSELLSILLIKKLNYKLVDSSKNAMIIEFDVWAKPGARIEKQFISSEGVVVIQTRAKPVEGEANASIVEQVGELFGVAKSKVEIIRGDKSRNKRIKLLVEITANKDEKYFKEKFTSLLNQEA